MQDSFDILEEKVKKAAELVRKLRKENKSLDEQVREARTKLAEAEKKLAALEAEVGASSGDAEKLEALTTELETLKSERDQIRARVTKGARLRIEKMAAHKIAARRAAAFLALPFNAPLGAELQFRTADAIWRGIGDASTDFNYYSKRLLLSGVIAATLLYWFADESEDAADTWAFLDRRIENVMGIEKAKAGIRDFAAKLPDPFRILGSLRYPSKGK